MFIKIYFKALISLLVLCFFSKISSSQTVYSTKEYCSFGFVGSMTSSDIYKDTINYESGIGIGAGGCFTLTLSDKSNVGIEVVDIVKTIKRSHPIQKYYFNFVDIPLYYQYKLSEKVKFNIGLQYSVFAASKFDTLSQESTSGVKFAPLKTNVTNDIGILGGVEFGFLNNWFISGRYTMSLTPFTNKNTPYFGVFQLSLKCVVFKGHKQIFHKKGNGDPLF